MNKMSGFFGGVVGILVVVQYADAQTVHVVGDGNGWRVPEDASLYQNWASGKSFRIGDILSFNFETQQHNVIEVSENSYDSCSSANPIGAVYSNGPTNITLSTSGEHYYICGVRTHCANGQRLAIAVSASASALPPSTTTPPSPISSASTSFPNFLHFLFFFSAFMVIPL